jgi:hypothetical protein
MAQYYGYVRVPHGSYQQWRDATLGNGYDVDGWYGDQCWDFCALLYRQYGLTLVTKAGGGGAVDCWRVSRYVNSQPPFESFTGVQNIKRGDILVFNATPYNSAGHICFADADYSDSFIDANGVRRLACLGQNQRGNGSGYPATVDNINLANFLGIFRNTMWRGDTPTPTPESMYNRNRYNFVLFNRRKRQEKWTKKLLKRR